MRILSSLSAFDDTLLLPSDYPTDVASQRTNILSDHIVSC